MASRFVRYPLLLLAGGVLGTVGALVATLWQISDPRGFVPTQPPPPIATRSVAIVQIGPFPEARLDRLLRHMRAAYSIAPTVLPAIDLPRWAYTPIRRQYYFEGLYRHMKESHPETAADESIVMIGLTNVDMYVRRETWRFAFTYRSQGRFAIVATGRTDRLPAPGVPGVGPDQATADARLRKLVGRTLGFLYYGFDVRLHPRSVLYPLLWGVEELDAMSEEF